jgi:hypothetical protein
MPPLQEIVSSLFGAWRLARFDPAGIGFINASIEGARRSFFAAAIVAPAYALMLAVRFSGLDQETDAARFVIAETIAYVLSWVAYPLAMVPVSRALGRFDRYAGYVSAYNWSLVLQNALVLPLVILSASGLLPGGLIQMLWLFAIIAITAYVWFIARTALAISGTAAIGIVALDFVLSFLISGAADGLH